ncbi:MAG: NAD(P)/FAD-dependent oxidoreductase [Alphaproteobacteria bacterium]|nr:NAD(P)/FAD-dependent oxidoreductase [Alphaproteobacteria bacterium]
MTETIEPKDVVIIGGGHNGLVCAAYLARAGRSVTVVEKNASVGGAAVTETFHPGFRNSVASYTVSLLNPKIIRELELARHGLKIIERPAANFWPVDEGRALLLPYGLAARQAAIAEFSKADAERLPDFEATLERACDVIRDLLLETPPNTGDGLYTLLKSVGMARKVARLPLADKRLITDLFTKSATEFLDPWFESDVVKAAFAFDGIVGAFAAPSSPGTAYVLLHHCFGEVNGKTGVWGHARGGMGAISDAIAASALESGVEIRTSAPVEQVTVEAGRAVGVRLTSGEDIAARSVAANVAPKLLFRDLVPVGAVSEDLTRRFLSIRSGSGTFRMNVALSELPNFRSRPGTKADVHHGSGIIIGASLGYLEKAYLDARQNGWSAKPIIEMVIPSTLDPSLAPEGKHVASLFVQHVAPKLPAPRSWQDQTEKEEFADLVIDTITAHAANFRSSIIARQVLSPLDLEHRFGLVDGDIFHGQLSLDQLFSLRPVMGFANYRLPLAGLYLCGSGAHPGGGVTGVPGHNAAREILRDLRRSKVWAG